MMGMITGLLDADGTLGNTMVYVWNCRALLQFLELEGSVSNDMSYVISKGSCQLIFKEWHRICDDVVAGVCMRNEISCFWQAL